MVQALWKVFVEEDATLVEVNPLARLSGDVLEALDGKVSLDENAEFRHEDHAAFEIREEDGPARGEGQGQGPQLRQARRRRSASSATAPAWSCRPSTWSRTPARSTAA